MIEFDNIIKKFESIAFENITLTNVVDADDYGIHFYFKFQVGKEKTYFKIDVVDLIEERNEIHMSLMSIASNDLIFQEYTTEILASVEKIKAFLKENFKEIPKYRLLLLMNEIKIK
jgi:hypothetical protein